MLIVMFVVVFFFHAWIFSGEDLGGYFHICGFTSNSMSVLKRMWMGKLEMQQVCTFEKRVGHAIENG